MDGYRWWYEYSDLVSSAEDLALGMLYHEQSKVSSANRALGQQQIEVPGIYEQYVMSRSFSAYGGASTIILDIANENKAEIGQVLRNRRTPRNVAGPVTKLLLSAVLSDALAPTAVISKGEDTFLQMLRPWPSAGALYPIDFYIIATEITGIPPAVYHYNIAENSLEPVAPHDPHSAQFKNSFLFSDVASQAPVIIVLVACFDRTSAKYGAHRGYRLAMLDAGHASQTVLLAATGRGAVCIPLQGFSDDSLAEYIGVDGHRVAPVHTILLGHGTPTVSE